MSGFPKTAPPGTFVQYAPKPSGDTTGTADTAAIQALLNLGGFIQLQPAPASAPYYIKASLQVAVSGTTLAGCGADATVLFCVNGFSGNPGIWVPPAVSNCVIRAFKIDGNKAGQGATAHINVDVFGSLVAVRDVHSVNANGYGLHASIGASDVQFIGNFVEGSVAEGIEVEGAQRVVIQGNVVRNAGKNGIYVWSDVASGGTAKDVTVVGNLVSNSSNGNTSFTGIYVDDGATNVTVDGNVVVGGGTTANGISCASSTANPTADISIVGNVIDTAPGYGILLNGSNLVISGNTVLSAGVEGIRVQAAATQWTVSNNVIQSPATYGIRVEGAARGTVANNQIVGTVQQAVLFNTGSAEFSCTGNVIETNTREAVYVSTSSNGVVTGNIVRAGSNGNAAIRVAASTGITVTANKCHGGGTGGSGPGISVEAASTGVVVNANVCETLQAEGIAVTDSSNVTVTSNVCRNNGVGGNASHSNGITVAVASGSVSNITLIGNRCYDDQGASQTQLFGVMTTGAVDQVTAIGNDLTTNKTAGVSLSGTATNQRFMNNRGYNPVGVVSPAVPATTVAVAAAGYDRTFYITNGAASSTFAIANGPTITVAAAALATIRLPAGQTLTPTYTSAPTWVVEGE